MDLSIWALVQFFILFLRFVELEPRYSCYPIFNHISTPYPMKALEILRFPDVLEAIEMEHGFIKMGLVFSCKNMYLKPEWNKRLFIVSYQNSFSDKMNKIHTWHHSWGFRLNFEKFFKVFYGTPLHRCFWK